MKKSSRNDEPCYLCRFQEPRTPSFPNEPVLSIPAVKFASVDNVKKVERVLAVHIALSRGQ